jgi:hypothetical protein
MVDAATKPLWTGLCPNADDLADDAAATLARFSAATTNPFSLSESEFRTPVLDAVGGGEGEGDHS